MGLWGMAIGLGAILNVARHVADLAYSISHVKAPPPKVLGILAVSVLFGVFWQDRVRLLASIPAGLALALWVHFPRPDVLISGDGRLVGVMVQGTRVLNSAKGTGFVARSWLENDGRSISQKAAHGAMPSWFEIVGKGAHPVQPCEKLLVVVQDWRSGLVWVDLIWDVSRQREAWRDGLINLAGCNGPQFGIRSGIHFGTVQSCVLRIAITTWAISRLNRCGSARPICPVF